MVVRARDVMTTRVVSVAPGTALDHVRYVLTENRFSALPVVDDRYRLVGIVTTFDLLRADTDSDERPASTVADVMTRNPLTMAPDAPITIIAHRMREYGELRAMPIVERGVLAWVALGTRVLGGVRYHGRRLSVAAHSTRELRRQLQARPSSTASPASRSAEHALDRVGHEVGMGERHHVTAARSGGH